MKLKIPPHSFLSCISNAQQPHAGVQPRGGSGAAEPGTAPGGSPRPAGTFPGTLSTISLRNKPGRDLAARWDPRELPQSLNSEMENEETGLMETERNSENPEWNCSPGTREACGLAAKTDTKGFLRTSHRPTYGISFSGAAIWGW